MRLRTGVVVGLTLMAVFLAGCASQPPAAGSPTPTGSESIDPETLGDPLSPEEPSNRNPDSNGPSIALDCVWSSEAFTIPAALVEPLVPEDYVVASAGPGLASLIIHALRCQNMVLNSTSTLNDTSFVFTTTIVFVDEDQFGAGFYDYYLLEAAADSEEYRTIWNRHGLESIPIHPLDRENLGPTTSLSITDGDQIRYDFREVPGAGQADVTYSDAFRFHYTDLEDRTAWIEFTGTSLFESIPRSVELSAQGGAIGGLSPIGSLELAGTSTLGSGSYRLEYHP